MFRNYYVDVLVAAAGFSRPGPIYTSTNSGLTWISNAVPLAYCLVLMLHN